MKQVIKPFHYLCTTFSPAFRYLFSGQIETKVIRNKWLYQTFSLFRKYLYMDIFSHRHIIKQYIDQLNHPNTVALSSRILNRFINHLALIKIIRFQDVMICHLSDYHKYLERQNLANSYIRLHLQQIKHLFAYLEASGLIFVNPAEALKLPKNRHKSKGVLSEKSIDRLFKQPNTSHSGVRDRTILEVFYTCGLKLDEVANLNLLDVNIDEKTLHVTRPKNKVILLFDQTAQRLHTYITQARPDLLKEGIEQEGLWISRNTGNRLTRMHIQRQVRNYGRRAGICESVTPHALRRSGVRYMVKHGRSPEEIKIYLGYSQLCHIGVYSNLTITEMRKINANYKKRSLQAS